MKNNNEANGISNRTMIYDEAFNKRIEELAKRNIHETSEKGYSSELNLRGRISAFEEHFEGIPLEEQEHPIVGPIYNILESESFQKGRERGLFLIKNGFTQEQYKKFLTEFEAKYQSTKKHR